MYVRIHARAQGGVGAWIHAFVYLRIRASVYLCTCVCTRARVDACVHARVDARVQLRKRARMRAYVGACVRVRVCVCACAHVCSCVKQQEVGGMLCAAPAAVRCCALLCAAVSFCMLLCAAVAVEWFSISNVYFENIPVKCFRAYSSGMLSSV